jgi:leucyl-tRNA synthetase
MEEVPLSDRFAKVNPSRNIKQLAQGWPSAEAIQSRHVEDVEVTPCPCAFDYLHGALHVGHPHGLSSLQM